MNLKVFKDDDRWRDFLRRASFSGRTLLAVGIALFLSFDFQLQSPMSSVTTVMIVANPAVGALIAKSVWRVLGTMIGAAIGVALMAVFPQAPILYFVALSVVIGLSCLVATLLNLFKAYGAVLTGYTIMIVTAPTFYNPDSIFLSAMSRLSAVTVGIVVTMVVFMVTSVRRPEKILQQLATLFHSTVTHALTFHEAAGRVVPAHTENSANTDPTEFRSLPHPLYEGGDRLLGQMTSMSSAVEYAATDNMEIRERIGDFRRGLSGLAGVVATYHPYWSNIAAPSMEKISAHQWMASVLADLTDLTRDPSWMTDPTAAQSRIKTALRELDSFEISHQDLDSMAVIGNLRDILAQLYRIIGDFSGKRVSQKRDIKIKSFLDWPTAIRNGMRGMIITFLAGVIWYVFRWSSGPLFLLYIVAASSLLSTTPSASRASKPMAIGTLLAVPAGLLCHLFFLPRIDGFPLLWFVIGIFLLPGIWCQFSPRLGLVAFGYGVFFAILLNVSNPIHYDDIILFNNWIAISFACVILVLVFKVVLPPDDRHDAARLITSLVKSVQRLASQPLSLPLEWVEWEGLQLQKITRIRGRLTLYPGPINRREYVDAAHATLMIGRLIVRIRHMEMNSDLSSADRAEIEEALSCFSVLRTNPIAVSLSLHDVAERVVKWPTGLAGASDLHRIAACLGQIAFIIGSLPGFFDRHGPIQLSPDMKQSLASLSTPVPALSPFLGLERA